jgi:hypothetical protein
MCGLPLFRRAASARLHASASVAIARASRLAPGSGRFAPLAARACASQSRPSGTPASASAPDTRAARLSGARSTNPAPSGKVSQESSAAALSARRVLPTPPGPCQNGQPRSAQQGTASPTSRVRPTKLVSCKGRGPRRRGRDEGPPGVTGRDALYAYGSGATWMPAASWLGCV